MMKYMIGIDSDGTIFDTMNVKHNEVFWQCMIEIWDLHDEADRVLEKAKKINLYSFDRGINRFHGLLKVMECTDKCRDIDKMPLKEFINSGYPLSNDGLKDYIKDSNMDCELLLTVLKWSQEIDKRFAEKAENVPPFKMAKAAFETIRKKAEIVIVSSASYHLLVRDLTKFGLSEYITKIMGQENGKKEQQLNSVINEYSPDKILMIGDAVSDYNSAKKAGALFYPIIPGKEEESWQAFNDTYFDCFINNSYDEKTEAKLYNQFKMTLSMDV